MALGDAGVYEFPVQDPLCVAAKEGKHVFGIKPRSLVSSHKGRMAGVRVGIEVFDHLCHERIEMNVTNQFKKIGVLPLGGWICIDPGRDDPTF